VAGVRLDPLVELMAPPDPIAAMRGLLLMEGKKRKAGGDEDGKGSGVNSRGGKGNGGMGAVKKFR